MCFAHFFPAYLYVFKLSMIVELDTAEHFIFAAFFIVYFDTLHYGSIDCGYTFVIIKTT